MKSQKRALAKVFIISILIDWGFFTALAPLLLIFPGGYLLEELLEQFISIFLARLFKESQLKLKWIDRVIGALPVPGVTPVTIAVVRTLIFNRQ